MPSRAPKAWKPLLAGLALGLGAIAYGGACKLGGEGLEAPASDKPDPAQDQFCKSPGDLMPEFFKLLRAGELAPLKEAVGKLTEEDKIAGTNVKELSPLNRLLDATFAGFTALANDPPESDTARCLPTAPEDPAKRNRLCEVGRSLGRLLRDCAGPDGKPADCSTAGAVKVGERFIETASPIILKILKYVNGHGTCPAATPDCPFVHPHYNGLIVVGGIIARSEGPCDPTFATDMLDKMLGFMGADEGPEKSLRLLGSVEAMLADPVMQEFLDTFTQGANTAGKGAFKILSDALLNAFIDNPDGDDPNKYFDTIAKFEFNGSDVRIVGGALKTLYDFLKGNAKWKGLLDQVLALLVDVVKPMLHPEVGIEQPLRQVLDCSRSADSEGHFVSAMFDLLKAKDEEGGIDLAPLMGSLKALAAVDTDGTIMRSIRELLRLQARNEESVLALRDVLRRALDGECDEAGLSCTGTVTKIFPAVEVLAEHGVITEFLLLMDQLVYGCEKPPGS